MKNGSSRSAVRRFAPAFALLLFVIALRSFSAEPPADAGALWQVGAASVDVTPDYPVRLSGYGNRRTESEGVAQRIHAKALAIGGDAERPAVVITVDNVGVPAA